jgi:trehalose 6-phosphate phosphatase
MQAALSGRRPVLFLDYDGTLAPIVSDPAKAVLSDSTRVSCEVVARRRGHFLNQLTYRR